jgi:hypothetical protein
VNKIYKYLGLSKTIFSLAIFVTACSPARTIQAFTTTPLPAQPTPIEKTTPTLDVATQTIVLTPTLYSSAIQDETLDINCRITINFFFDFRKGFDIQAFRDLFLPSSQGLADAYTVHPPLEPRTILVLMPASEWWQKKFPATPIPGALMPESPNEHIYSVEFTGYYDPDTTPFYAYPDYMTLVMVSDGPYSCKIKNYGKG